VAIDRDGLSYPPEVVSVIGQDRPDDYRAAAGVLAALAVDAVVIEHEYGIFGGVDGGYVLYLADELRRRGVPYLVTLHTVLSRPSGTQAAVLAELTAGAAKVTVFTEAARRLAAGTGVAALDRLVVVPHGAPTLLRAYRGRRGRIGPVLSTFGLLGPGKGLETAITALARIVPGHPSARYVIAGATHPEVSRLFGEEYRDGLRALAEELGLASHVEFVDRFLTDEQLADLLGRTDVFITPYRSPEQICSGALTFALVAGCPVVSTRYFYAEEMLAGGAGRLVPCGDPEALADALDALLGDPAAYDRARSAADALGAQLTWPMVGDRLAQVVGCAARPPIALATAERLEPPPLRLDHLDVLVDHVGIVQFARQTKPDLDSGYCVDDAARLILVADGLAPYAPARAAAWTEAAVGLLTAAYRPDGMHNMRSFDGRWLDEPHLGDHVGRAIWATGVLARRPGRYAGWAAALRDRLLALPGTKDLRSQAYTVLGVPEVGADGLDAALAAVGDDDWYWFEDRLTYDNARLVQAMIVGGTPAQAERGLAALDWYLDQVTRDGLLRLVGNCWRWRGADRGPDGDEQPIDAGATVETLVAAYRRTGSARYGRLARRAFSWFLGANRLGVWLYDPISGGCHDGLSIVGVNGNEGAESTLAYYQALTALLGVGLATWPTGSAGRVACEV